jgi:hypothetical protein
MIKLSPGWLGFIRGIGVVALTAVLAYVGDATHLGFLNSPIAALISAAALALEQSIEGRTGSALFGAVRSA